MAHSSNTLPRILIIDDQLGRCAGPRNRLREDFCFSAGLIDRTGDVATEQVPDVCGEACFIQAQIERNGAIENDQDGSLDYVISGFREPPRWSLVLLDLHFKTGKIVEGEPVGRDSDRNPRNYFGLQILKAIRTEKKLNDLPVIILSSMERSDSEDIFSGLGVFDFCDKSTLNRQKMRRLLEEHGLLSDDVLLGQSLSFLICLREARRRAFHGGDNILLTGETGTGKELLANYIHRWSERSGPYIPLFTQGVPESLIEDRLFGHDKGAFMGATVSTPGAAEAADKGILFIDEFGDIPPATQTKLLRLLDPNIREVQRLGSTKALKLDLQVVLATSRVGILEKDDSIRDDLLYRVKAGNPIILPPLRKRLDDIPILAEHFLRKYENQFNAEPREITVETMDVLQEHDWPGNVRDLERVIENAVLSYKGLRLLQPQHLNLKKIQIPPRTETSVKLTSPHVGPEKPPSKAPTDEFHEALRALNEFPYYNMSPQKLVGSYNKARETMARCLVGLLRQALVTTSKPTAENPEGEIYYTPAVHLLLGLKDQEKKKWRTPKCADLVRQIINTSETIREELLTDRVLRAAYDAATRLRKKK